MSQIKPEELDALFNNYQASCKETNKYPAIAAEIVKSEHLSTGTESILNFLLLGTGIAGETGELVEKFKKVIRDKKYTIENGKVVITPSYRTFVVKEFGDLFYYLGQAMMELDISMSEVLKANLNKVHTRNETGKVHGDGDER